MSYVQKLKVAESLLNTNHQFKPGDLVQWKQGLLNKSKPFMVMR